jgi:hypothetical protein
MLSSTVLHGKVNIVRKITKHNSHIVNENILLNTGREVLTSLPNLYRNKMLLTFVKTKYHHPAGVSYHKPVTGECLFKGTKPKMSI